jgi:hypothetical protein
VEFVVDLEFISGDRITKAVTGLNKTAVIDKLSGDNWFEFTDEEFINMSNVKSFKVVSKQQREEEEEQQAKEYREAIENFRF